MASTSSCEISSGDWRRLRYFYVVTKCGQKVIAKMFKPIVIGNSSKTIGKHLEDIDVYKMKGKKLERVDNAYRKWFNNQELYKIDNNIPAEDLDITLLFKICTKSWENNVNVPSDKLKALLKEIKDERNVVCHEDCQFTQPELEAKLTEYETKLKDALAEATILYPSNSADFTQISTEIGEAIRKVKVGDYKLLKDELKVFVDQLRYDIQEESRSVLISLYERLCKILPFEWLPQCDITDPSKIMVSLTMDTDKDLHLSQFGSKSAILDQGEILTKKAPSGDDPDVVIISGDAGAGKSSLLSLITENWYKGLTQDFHGLSRYNILLRTEFRKHAVDNFDDYLRELLPNIVLEHDFQNLKSSILQSRCLFLCDGYDEANDSSKKLFKDILELKSNDMKIIITSRPIHKKELTAIVNRSQRTRLNLSLLGIPEKSQISLITIITKYHRKNDTDTERNLIVHEITKAFHSMTPEMKALLKTPLFMNLYVLLLSTNPKLRTTVTTLTKLFIELMKHNSRRMIEKLEIADEDKVLKFEEFYKQQSLKGHLQKRYYELTEVEAKLFKEKCEDLELPFEKIMSTFFNVKLSTKSQSLDIVNIYCYRHRTEQEFAAAGAICDNIVNICKKDSADPIHQDTQEGENIISRILNEMKLEDEDESEGESSERDTVKKDIQKILDFVSGILYNRDKILLGRVIKHILDMIHREDDYGVLNIDKFLHHLSETESIHSVRKAVITTLEAKRAKTWGIKDGKHLSLVQKVLSETRSAPSLQIRLENDDPEDHPGLIPAIDATIGKKIYLKLHLDSHLYGEVKGYSDKYFRRGYKSILEFRGSLSRNAIEESLKEAQKMTKLELRMQNIEELESLSCNIQSLKNLSWLYLWFSFDVTADPKKIVSPLAFRGETLSIWIEQVDEGEDKPKKLSSFLNSLLAHRNQAIGETTNKGNIFIRIRNSLLAHRNQAIGETTNKGKDYILISNSHFTKEAVVELLSTLNTTTLWSIRIRGTVDISATEKNELQKLAGSLGLIELDIR